MRDQKEIYGNRGSKEALHKDVSGFNSGNDDDVMGNRSTRKNSKVNI